MKFAQSMRAAPQARRMQWLLAASVSFALTACGGGGGGDSGGTPPTPPAQTNTAPTAQAGTDQTIQLPTNSVSLAGSATDAENNPITYSWSATPAGVTFASASAASTTATFPGEGTYTLTLTASDGALSGTDTVTVTVQAAGSGSGAPTVNAGADQTIQLPTNSVSLSGSATDPEGSAVTYAWSATPAGVTFADASAAATTATFVTPGTYTLTLTASDGSVAGTDTLQVVVQSLGNTAPAVNAGPDLTLYLPRTTTTLSGSAVDDSIPSNNVTYTWATTVPGASIATPSAASTQVTVPAAAGTYAFTLTANDGELSTTDTINVSVSASAVTTLIFPGADAETDPNHGWTRTDPANVSMDAALLEQAKTYSLTGGVGGLNQGGSGVVIRYGKLVYSWGDIDERYDLKSTTKSIGGMALGLAIDDNRLGLRDSARTHFPSIGVPGNDPADPRLANITLLQLATHTAGFPKDAGFQALQSNPGAQWFYSDGGLNWLADVLTNVYAQDLNVLMKTRVWDPLQITTDDLRWRNDATRATSPHPAGVPRREFASGIFANTNAMARIGLLFLAEGKWNAPQILSQDFVQTVRTPQPETASATNADTGNFPSATTDYGVLWWTNTTDTKLTNVPRDAYWAWGLGDSLIVVIPSLHLVIARTGNDPDVQPDLPAWRTNWNGNYDVLKPFLEPIVQSITP